ncbi:MAG: M14 family zinc carboxypeptidase [candidate division Zixibacteria bacterium]|nr:M14 family zinc carboxypeptidase [candidate division Zixibacteria bacterium]
MQGRVTKTLVIMLVLAVLTASASATQMQVRLYIDDPKQLLDIRQLHLDQTFQKDGYIDIVTDQEELRQIEALGIRTEVLHEDIVKYNQSRLDPAKDMGGYMTLDELNTRMDDLIAAYPNLLSQKISLGQTLEGRDIWAFKLSDNPNVTKMNRSFCTPPFIIAAK